MANILAVFELNDQYVNELYYTTSGICTKMCTFGAH